MNKKHLLTACLFAAASSVMAQKPMNAPTGGKAISNELIGIFFEDISMAADGGLNAQLIQNGSFEYSPADRDGWGAGTGWRVARPGHSLGLLEVKMDSPINENNPTYMRLNVERTRQFYDYDGWAGFGLQNDGYDGISIKAGAKYDFSIFMRNVDGISKKVRVVLSTGWGKDQKALGEVQLVAKSKSWDKYEAVIEATEDCTNANLQVLVLDNGAIDVDMISLVPQDTYKGHGLRKDLCEALEALNPKFMRFPGGCVVHGGGDGFWDTYRWKTTVGPKEQRKGLKNTWGYHQSMEIGYFEYFQLCEDMGMQPVPILPCGVSCQGTNGGWNLWPTQAQDVVPMEDMDEWVDEALDLIEWANGDVNTKWGKVRAEAGHPAPFNLKYLGIGNEEKISPEFIERFKYMYKIITEKHPEIVIVGTAGPGSHPGNPDFENGWKLAEELEMPILDEHYYEPREYFLNNQANYDNYPRDRKTKVYLGEYASKDKKWEDALYEALYLMGIERNGDVVCMTSYAPLFARKTNTNWNPDMIYFDNEKAYLTCSYYVQQLFGKSSGDTYYGDCVKFDNGDKYQSQSVVLNTKTRELFVKVCNASGEAKNATIDLSRFGSLKAATKTTISGKPEDENNYEVNPIAPVTENTKVTKNMKVEVAPYTVMMYSIKL